MPTTVTPDEFKAGIEQDLRGARELKRLAGEAAKKVYEKRQRAREHRSFLEAQLEGALLDNDGSRAKQSEWLIAATQGRIEYLERDLNALTDTVLWAHSEIFNLQSLLDDLEYAADRPQEKTDAGAQPDVDAGRASE